MNISPLPPSLPPTLPPSFPSPQTFGKMQTQMGTMRLPGRLPANETQVQVPAFDIATKTEGYCGMCNVPGYVLWK